MIGSTAVPLAVRFWGVRGSTPTPAVEMLRYGGNTSCLEVRSGDQLLILDAGTGIRRLGESLAQEFGNRPLEADLLISHTHWDHIQGLPFFAPAYLPHNRIRVLAPYRRAIILERALRNQMEPLHFPVGLDEMRGLTGVEELESDNTSLGNLSLQVKSLNHPGGCAGFRVECGEASMAYLPDHEPYGSATAERARRRALIEFLLDVDVLILDTQYTQAEYPHRLGWGHGCLPDSVGLAVEANASRLILFHHDPSHVDDQIDEMVAAAQAMAGQSPLLVEGARENQILHFGIQSSPKNRAPSAICRENCGLV